jgi:predicted transcriptional regulator
MNLPKARRALQISQSRLARLAGVSRFKICLFELGDGSLSTDEQMRISAALEAEAERLRNVTVQIEFGPATLSLPRVSGD